MTVSSDPFIVLWNNTNIYYHWLWNMSEGLTQKNSASLVKKKGEKFIEERRNYFFLVW